MGKEKKAKRHQWLAQQILEGDQLRARRRLPKEDKKVSEGGSEEYVEGSISRKILQQARLQQEELEEEFGIGSTKPSGGKTVLGGGKDKGKSLLRERNGDNGSEDESGTQGDLQVAQADDDFCPVVSEADMPAGTPKIDEMVESVFKSVGKILSKYWSGKFPKAVKVYLLCLIGRKY